MAASGGFAGALLGRAFGGPAGLLGGGAAGLVLGAFLGVAVGGFAWVLESPRKGAVRAAGLLAATMGALLLIGGLANGAAPADAAGVVVLAAGMAGAAGAVLGAFLAWLTGPLIRSMVRDMDRGESPFRP